MKNIITTPILLAPFIGFAQISIIDTDMAVVGDTIPRQQDTIAASQGPSGADQIWDFTSADSDELVTTSVLAPNATPYGADFISSNLAMTSDGLGFIYFSINTNNLFLDGAAGDLLGTGEILKAPFNPDLTLNEYSTDYGDNFVDTYGFDVKADGSAFSALIDSIRIKHTGTVYDTVDGWGTLKIPTGDFNVLRIKRVEYSIDSIWTKLPDPIWPLPPSEWTFFDALIDTGISYTWLGKEGKIAVAEMSFDSLDVPSLTWTLMPPLPIADFTYTDNSSGLYSFTDVSANTPSAWSWTFGDGQTATVQNPSNQYASNGTFNVCLTATNSVGSHTYCESVVVTGIPTPPIAQFSYTDNSTGGFTFADQSQNTPTSWLWDFGDATSSTLQNPVHQYLTDSTYTVCLTATNTDGSDSTCQIFAVVGVVANPVPIASFTDNDMGGGLVDFTDQSISVPTSWAWTFGDATTSTQQSPSHTYSVVGQTYTVCLTATNGNGSSVPFCKSVFVADSVGTPPGIERVYPKKLIVFPNPSSDFIRIKTEILIGGTYQCVIYDMQGQSAYMERLSIYQNDDVPIPVHSLPPGLYMLELTNGLGNSVYSGKISIQR